MSQDVYDKIMMLAKRRGFIYPSFEIYGGVAGFYDYGPLGSRLKQNIEDLWRNYYLMKDNCVEINTPTVTLYEVLKASGHVDEFTDLTVDCKKCKRSYKVEDIIDEEITVEQAIKEHRIKCPTCGTTLKNAYNVNLMFSTTIGVGEGRQAFLRPETAQGIFTDFHLLYRYAREKLPFGVVQVGRGYRNEVSPRQGIIRLREFSMAEAEIFFDPEDKTHPSFDRVKEKELYLFENEKEMKISLEKAVKTKVINNQALAYYMYLTQDFLMAVGVDPKKFRFRKHAPDELAHYATECWDAELYSERFGWVECVGIADRSAYDLKAHEDTSGQDMSVFRESTVIEEKRKILSPVKKNVGSKFRERAAEIIREIENKTPEDINENGNLIIGLKGEKIELNKEYFEIKEITIGTGKGFTPHVIEPSYGIDRILYFLLEHNYSEGKKKDEKYRILKLNSKIAPIKAGVFPLVSDEKLIEIAKKIDRELRNAGIPTYYDESGTIGRRYARLDEIGTPFCITIDHDTLEDGTVTIRDRDTTKQVRKNIDEVIQYIKDTISY